MEVDTTNQPPTSRIWQLVVHRPIKELEELNVYLKGHCSKYIAKQHDADEEISRTHVHYSLKDINISKQALTKFLNKLEITGSDNFGILTVHSKTKTPYKENLLDEYVMKGSIDNAVWHGVETEYLQTAVNNWVDYKNQPFVQHKRPDKENLSEWESIKKEALAELTEESIGLDQVRKWLMRRHWKKEGRLPHVTSYKRNACSVYLMLIEKLEPRRCTSTALDEIMEWNY